MCLIFVKILCKNMTNFTQFNNKIKKTKKNSQQFITAVEIVPKSQ